MSVQLRIRLSEDLIARLEAHAAETLRSKDRIIEAALSEYLAACLNLRQGLSQSETAVGAVCTTTAQPVEKPAVRDPLHGAKPGDTDEILDLIRTLNAMPESCDLTGDVVWVNQARRVEIQRHIGRLREALTA